MNIEYLEWNTMERMVLDWQSMSDLLGLDEVEPEMAS